MCTVATKSSVHAYTATVKCSVNLTALYLSLDSTMSSVQLVHRSALRQIRYAVSTELVKDLARGDQ